ncbi:endonuclease/exonuclease/phosphatase family protein [Pontibacter sp. SGAir0037]|uniref:endonuclease/exonuclease/phosphatase family protein n=1 Tax=Pontibacter sp. SGAir0037 TaxID=2571030 RepID=UPI0010CD41AA|nr:endonuclease/exonuclease/phosphatase family protein [Pontibacter sp. SGAir0037]QCR23010.1 endonuclease [Pontibacter sp. SGAir0037]
MRYGIKTLLLLFTTITFTGCASLFQKDKNLHTVAFYNVEKLYDTQASTERNDLDFTPGGALAWDDTRYRKKISNLANVMQDIGGKKGATLIGLSEVENQQVVKDLMNTTPLKKHNYAIIHYESPDIAGLDLAFLYNPKQFTPTAHRTIPVENLPRNTKTREIVEIKGLLQKEPITIYLNHWPDNTGNVRAGAQNRRAAATTLRKLIDNLLEADPNAKIIVMGDFGELPSSPILENVLKATGRPNPAYNKELFNIFYMAHVQGNGSVYRRNKFQMLDQIMVSKSFLNGQGLQYVRGSEHIHAPDFAKHNFGKLKNSPIRTFTGTTYLGGYSDHFPIYIKLQKGKR